MLNKQEFKNLLEKAIGDNTITEFSKLSGVNRTYLSKYINQSLDRAPNPDILKTNVTPKVSYNELMIAAGYLEPNKKK